MADAPPPPPKSTGNTFQPIAVAQLRRNRAACFACARCGSLGAEPLVHLAAKRFPRDQSEVENALAREGVENPEKVAKAVFFCGLGCGET